MLEHSSTILLTGATSGIGRALFEQLQKQGHQLIVVARSRERLSALQNNYENVVCYPCDLSSRADVESLANKIVECHPTLNILINNAGVQFTPSLLDEDFDFDSIEHETIVNFLAPLWLSYLLLPSLLGSGQQAGIINISSGLAFAPKTQSAVYCANKAALHSLSQSLRYQLSNTNVQVIEAIMPLVDTPMTAGRGSNKISPDEAARQIIKGLTQGRDEIYVGKAKVLPLLIRLSPALVKTIMRRY